MTDRVQVPESEDWLTIEMTFTGAEIQQVENLGNIGDYGKSLLLAVADCYMKRQAALESMERLNKLLYPYGVKAMTNTRRAGEGREG